MIMGRPGRIRTLTRAPGAIMGAMAARWVVGRPTADCRRVRGVAVAGRGRRLIQTCTIAINQPD